MSTDMDNDILQDFLIEAGELFSDLGEQLIELEQSPEDSELLNAIFRAFHSIKGGAGFLNLTEMVQACHVAEDVFNLLRQGERKVDATLIDMILQVLDALGDMFDQIRAGESLQPADPKLIAKLEILADPEGVLDDAHEAPAAQSAQDDSAASNDIASAEQTTDMDDEFEAMLDASAEQPDESKADGESDVITDDEFESLLNQLHGEGKHGAVSKPASASKDAAKDKASDIISDEEFEAALDQIHGKDKSPVVEKEDPVKVTEAVTEPVVAAVKRPEPLKPKPTAAKPAADKQAAKKKDVIHTETSVRVDTARLDDIMNLVGELVLVRNRLTTLKQDMKQGQVVDAISNLELVTSDLQSSVMKTRMQPIKKVFNRFPRVIRDLARQLNKDVILELRGEDTDLDKNLVEALADPMIHLVRNAVDHGIETPETRFSNGKPRQGKVVLSAIQEGDQIVLSVSDDGKGMDADVLRVKAVEKGMMDQDAASRLTDHEAFNLIFAPGFSTAVEVSDVSGRGVGMDVVKTKITELNGNVEIDSVKGQGSTITVRLPLTLAIMPTLMVTLGGYQFALPLANVIEAFNMEPQQISMVDGNEVILVREKPLPLFYLQQWLTQGAGFDGPQSSHKVIVVQMGSQRFCMVVDDLIGQEEVVIKPLSTMLKSTPGFTGATITGDGGIALILDIPSMMNAYASDY